MRLAILTLFLSTASAAFCQSPAPAPSAGKLRQEPTFPQPWANATKSPSDWFSSSAQPAEPAAEPHINFTWHPDKAKRDTRYPTFATAFQDLRQQHPLIASNRGAEPIPTQWPTAKFEKIPTDIAGYTALKIFTK